MYTSLQNIAFSCISLRNTAYSCSSLQNWSIQLESLLYTGASTLEPISKGFKGYQAQELLTAVLMNKQQLAASKGTG